MKPEQMWIDWTHPSYRDLVIEELLSDPGLQLKFLQSISLQGVKLAISDSGGASGDRSLPLMTSLKSWNLLRERCVQLVTEGEPQEISDLLKVLSNAALQVSKEHTKDHLRVIDSVCREARNKWDQFETVLKADELSAYCKASLLISPLPPCPRLDASWREVERERRILMDKGEPGLSLMLNNWVDFILTVQTNEPRFMHQIGFPDNYEGDITHLLVLIEKQLQSREIYDSYDELRAEAEYMASVAKILEGLSLVSPTHRQRSQDLADQFRSAALSLEDEASEHAEPEPDYDDEYYGGSTESFDIEGLFLDL